MKNKLLPTTILWISVILCPIAIMTIISIFITKNTFVINLITYPITFLIVGNAYDLTKMIYGGETQNQNRGNQDNVSGNTK